MEQGKNRRAETDDCELRVVPAPNGGYLLLKTAPLGCISDVIAAVSTLPELLSAIGGFYCRVAVVGDAEVSSVDAKADAVETAPSAPTEAESTELRYLVQIFDMEGDPMNSAVFFDKEAASLMVRMIRETKQLDATVKPVRSA